MHAIARAILYTYRFRWRDEKQSTSPIGDFAYKGGKLHWSERAHTFSLHIKRQMWFLFKPPKKKQQQQRQEENGQTQSLCRGPIAHVHLEKREREKSRERERDSERNRQRWKKWNQNSSIIGLRWSRILCQFYIISDSVFFFLSSLCTASRVYFRLCCINGV